MSTPFQNRLVGTIIVAAIAIIFLPDILDGEKKNYQDNFETIPAEPKLHIPSADTSFPKEKLAQLPQEKIVEELALDDVSNKEEINIEFSKPLTEKNISVTTLPKEQSFSSTKAAVTENKTIQENIKKKVTKSPNKSVKEQAWAIQLGSFRHQNNVDILIKKLSQNGYTVFTKPIKTKKGKLIKVFVGPELNKASLDKKLPALKKLTNVQGKVTHFYPTK